MIIAPLLAVVRVLSYTSPDSLANEEFSASVVSTCFSAVEVVGRMEQIERSAQRLKLLSIFPIELLGPSRMAKLLCDS